MTVKIYSSPMCPWCDVVKNFFESNNIPFEEIDVSQNEKAAEEIMKKTGQIGVPVIEINGQYVIGFNKPVLEKLLGLEKGE